LLCGRDSPFFSFLTSPFSYPRRFRDPPKYAFFSSFPVPQTNTNVGVCFSLFPFSPPTPWSMTFNVCPGTRFIEGLRFFFSLLEPPNFLLWKVRFEDRRGPPPPPWEEVRLVVSGPHFSSFPKHGVGFSLYVRVSFQGGPGFILFEPTGTFTGEPASHSQCMRQDLY